MAKTRTFLRDPQLPASAVSYLRNNGALPFTQLYGDQLVTGVVLGGRMLLVYTFEFDSSRDARDFRAQARATYGRASGAASFHQQILKTAAKSAITLSGVVLGAKSVPQVLSGAGADSQTIRPTDGRGQVAADLLTYFDNFEGVVDSTSAVPIEIEAQDLTQVKGILPTFPSFDAYREELERAAALDDIIDKRIAELEFMRTSARDWNPHVPIADIDDALRALKDIAKNVASEARAVANFKRQSISVTEASLPKTPRDWIARDLVSHAKMTLSRSNKIETTHMVIPQIEPGQYVGITVQMAKTPFATDPSRIVVTWVDASGKQIGDPVFAMPLTRGYINENVTRYMRPPADAQKIALYMETYGGKQATASVELFI